MTTEKTKRRRVAAWAVALACLATLLAWPHTAMAVMAKDPTSLDPSVRGTCRSETFDLLQPSDLPSDGPTGSSSAGKRRVVAQGDSESYLPLLIVVMGFNGQPYDDAHDWGGYIFAGNRSLSRYYTDMSFGKFTFLPAQETSAFGEDGNTNLADKPNDGIVHVSLDMQKTTGWAIYDDEAADREMLTAFHQALTQADDHVDFASYDSNGDGFIQNSELAICFVVSGIDAAYHGNFEYDDESHFIWPHAWGFPGYEDLGMPVVDGVAVNGYVAMAEYREGDGGSLVQEDIGQLAHELGHYIGLPDLYNTTYEPGAWSEFDVFAVSLMNYGCYGEDLEGNPRPYSLDMWSRVALGWVEPATLDTETADVVQIAGSLSTTSTPIAYLLDTPNEGEYYIIENRRFTSWDEGMGEFYRKYYPYGATGGDSSEDYGGGLVLWHIDDNIFEEHIYGNTINNSDHHPGVMPLFFEEDDDKNLCTIGSNPLCGKPFFDSDGWGRDVPLPLYGTMPDDTPNDRTLSVDLVLSLDSASAPVMDFHLHRLCDIVSWANDFSSARLWGQCQLDGESVQLATTTDITTKVVKKPSITRMGKVAYTAHFARYNLEDTTYGMIPSLGKWAMCKCDAALTAMRRLMAGACAALARGAYTRESFDALRGAISAAKALYEDDAVTEQDIAAAREELLRMWRSLVPVNSQERQALMEAAYGLAELLSEVCDAVDPQTYKPTAYASFAEVVDTAYGVLANEGSPTQELADAEADVREALAPLERDGKRVQISAATISGLKNLTYSGKALEPKPVVTLGGRQLVVGTDYELRYANNKSAGEATVTVVGMGDYTGETSATFTIAKAANPLEAKGLTANLSYAKLRKANQGLAVSKVVKFTNKGKGTLSYAKVDGSSKVSVDSATGKVSVRKGLKKGTYRVKVKISAAGNANYASASKTVTFTLKVA